MTLLDAALQYASAGYPVFPVRGKQPLTEHGFKDASRDDATVREWWTRWPDAGIGIPTGRESGLVVLDVDPRHGGDASLAELLKERGELPAGPRAKTGGGGWHFYFAHPGGTVRTVHGFRDGLDLQADLAYVVAPPSPHPSGGVYAWEVALDGAKLPLLPPWLFELADGGGASRAAPPVELGPDGRLPHGRHHGVIVETAASLATRIAGLSEAGLVESMRGALAPLLGDLPDHEPEIREAARSALAKFGRPAPADSPIPEVPDEPGAFEAHRARVAKIVRTKDDTHGRTILIWAAHSHLIARFQSTFYLGFKGKTGAGKGTAVESCIALTPNGEVLGETTESYLATATDEGKAIGVEELDLLLERNPFIESLFRSGYRRGSYGGFKIPKKDGSKGWENARRSLFGPKVYDTHAGPSGHLLGRSILIEMEPDDSHDRALDAEWKADALAPVRTWLEGKARRALAEWSSERFRAWWDSPEFRQRVKNLGGRGGRDHVIGALMLATCDMMDWSLDAEVAAILAGRATIEEFGIESEVLDALRDLAPTPSPETEVQFGELLRAVNEARKKTGVGRSLTQKSLASPLRELGFRKGGDGSDPADEWFKSNAGPARNKVVLRPYRVLSLYTPGNQAHQAHQAHLYRDDNALDAPDATDSGRVSEGPEGASPAVETRTAPKGLGKARADPPTSPDAASGRDPEDLLGPGPTLADRALGNARKEGSVPPDPPEKEDPP